MYFPFNLFAFGNNFVHKGVVKHRILVLVLLVVLGSTAWAGGSKPGFTLRIYMQASSGGSLSQSISMALSNPDQIIKVNKYAVLTEKNVESLMKLPDGGTLVTLTDTGMKIMDAETSNNLGSVMVVLCNGRLIYAPEIDAPLKSGKILLPAGPAALTESDYTLFRQYLVQRAKQ